MPPIRSEAVLALRSVESFAINRNPVGVTIKAICHALRIGVEKSEIVLIIISEATRSIVPNLYVVFSTIRYLVSKR